MVVLLEWALSASCLGAGCGFSVLPIVRQSHPQQSGFEQSARQFPEWTFRCEKDHVAVVVAIQAAAARASLTSAESAVNARIQNCGNVIARSEATKQSILALRRDGLLRFARNDDLSKCSVLDR
jgi:hypothetical protein